MKNSTEIKALSDVVGKIQRSQREKFRPQIECLQKFVGSTEDLFVDRRSVTWGPQGKARATIVERSKLPKPLKPPRPEPLKYLVEWRNGFRPIPHTATDAAKIARKTPQGLAICIAKSKHKVFCMTDTSGELDDIVTIKRL